MTLEDQLDPYMLSDTTKQKAWQLTQGLKSPYEKSLALYCHLHDRLEYERGNDRILRNAEETYHLGGNCLELSVLYTAMAREVNLDAGVTDIIVDKSGENLKETSKGHACANIKIHSKRILVDLAHNEFNAEHKEYKHLTDEEVKEFYTRIPDHHPNTAHHKKRRRKFLKVFTITVGIVSLVTGINELHYIAKDYHLEHKIYKIIKKITN